MPDMKIQRTIVALVIALVAVLAAGITNGWFGPNKVVVTNFPDQKDTLLVKTVDEKKDDTNSNPAQNKTKKEDEVKDNIPSTTNQPIKLPVNASEQEKIVERNQVELNTRKNAFIADYLISNTNNNQLEDLLQDIQTIVEQAGNSAMINNNENTAFQNLNGKYNRLITISVKLDYNTVPNTTDSRTISTSYSYSIKSYEVGSMKLINAITDAGVQPGFSKEETVLQIKKKIIPQIKSLL